MTIDLDLLLKAVESMPKPTAEQIAELAQILDETEENIAKKARQSESGNDQMLKRR